MYRFFEILPGALTWLTIALMFLLSWLAPAFIAVFIVLFDVYWLLKSIYLSLHLRHTFSEMRVNLKVDWLAKLRELERGTNSWRDIWHLVLMPMAAEPYEVVRESFESLVRADYPKEKFIVVLATEARAGAKAQEIAARIKAEFGNKFGNFLVTVHPADLPDEIPGKGSNEIWAAREAKRLVIDPLVNAQTGAERTLTDADGFLYKDLTYKIRGAVFSVKRKLGLGHKEVVYQKALEEEFAQLGLAFEKEKVVEVSYGSKKIGVYRPDFVIENKVILELKALPFISKLERRQVWHYLKGSDYRLALLVNFGVNDVYIKRIVYDTARGLPRGSASSQRKSALSYKDILVSVFDIDTQVPPGYFARLTCVFLNTPNNLRAIYQPIPFFTNNIYQAPALGRIVSFSATFWQMMQQARPERLTTFSSQSLPLQVVLDIGYWQKDIVSEDSRVFWQGYLRYHGDFRVVPLNFPVYMDANVAPTFWRTMLNTYKQQRRWAWGVENTPYLLTGFVRDRLIPLGKRWYWAFVDLEGRHAWATNSLLIFALGWLPLFLGGDAFNTSLLSYSLPRLTRYIINLSMLGIATSAILSVALLPPKPKWFRPWHYPLYILQWALLPITLIVFGALPAIDAQTRLMLGGRWRLGFWVTPKHRIQNLESRI